MRDFGTHVIPTVSALPASGVAGQMVNFSNMIMYWHAGFGQWLPVDDANMIPITTAYTNSTTTLSTVFSFAVVANASYEFEFRLHWQASALVAMKLAVSSPASSMQTCLATVSGVQSGTTAPTFLELGTSGTSQTGPAAAVINTNTFAQGEGVIRTTNAGTVSLMAAPSAAGTLTIGLGSRLEWRRNA